MSADEPQKSRDELYNLIQDAWNRVAERVGERDQRLINIRDLPQDDRDLYLVHDVLAITSNAGILAWIYYHHDEPGWIKCAREAFTRVGHSQVSDDLARGLEIYLAKRGSLTSEDGRESSLYVFRHEEQVYRALYRHLSMRQYFSHDDVG